MYNPVVVMIMAAPNTGIEARSAFLVIYLFLGLGFGFGLELGLVVSFVSLSLSWVSGAFTTLNKFLRYNYP